MAIILWIPLVFYLSADTFYFYIKFRDTSALIIVIWLSKIDCLFNSLFMCTTKMQNSSAFLWVGCGGVEVTQIISTHHVGYNLPFFSVGIDVNLTTLLPSKDLLNGNLKLSSTPYPLLQQIPREIEIENEPTMMLLCLCSSHSNKVPAIYTLQWRHNYCNGVSNHQRHDCLLNHLFSRSKKISKLRVTGLCEGNPPMTGGFPSQKTSTAENVSIWWRHHDTLVNLSYNGQSFAYATRKFIWCIYVEQN